MIVFLLSLWWRRQSSQWLSSSQLQQGAGAFPMATAQVMRMCGEFNGSVGVFWSKELARHWQISSYFIIFHDVSVPVCYLERGNGFKWFLNNAGPLKGFFVDKLYIFGHPKTTKGADLTGVNHQFLGPSMLSCCPNLAPHFMPARTLFSTGGHHGNHQLQLRSCWRLSWNSHKRRWWSRRAVFWTIFTPNSCGSMEVS